MGFPNLKGKHAGDSMVNPKEFMDYRKKIGKYPKYKPLKGVIICYHRSLMEHIITKHKAKDVGGFRGMHLLPETKNQIGVIGDFGIGAPIAVVQLEELIAFGVKKFISIGSAGTLHKNLKIGDLVVCEKAIRDEGTSHHYIKTGKYAYPSKETTTKIKETLHEKKLKFFSGTSWTIDAPYRETVAEAKQYQKEGVLTVEMEASALFAVAQYRGVELGAIFTISDSLAELKWVPKFHAKKVDKGLETLYQVALNVLLAK
ncbi:MAG: nucleoside phosphorylase [Nanoarchaeota archaeon]|nr:nucleoside phosphorylase [Nanoarchaeota archaeon]